MPDAVHEAVRDLGRAREAAAADLRKKRQQLLSNRRARRVLVEGAWTYRHPARVSETLRPRLEGLPKAIRDIARKAQIRLCARIAGSSPSARRRLWSSRRSPPK